MLPAYCLTQGWPNVQWLELHQSALCSYLGSSLHCWLRPGPTLPPSDYQCPISDIPSFYQSPLCLSSPCPHIRQSSPVWVHLPVWPVAALSPRSVICALKFLISPSLDGPLSSDDNKVRGATTVWWGCNGPDCRNAVSGWSYRAGLMAVNNKETLAITLALGPTLLRTKVQQVYTAFSCSQLLMSSLA